MQTGAFPLRRARSLSSFERTRAARPGAARLENIDVRHHLLQGAFTGDVTWPGRGRAVAGRQVQKFDEDRVYTFATAI